MNLGEGGNERVASADGNAPRVLVVDDEPTLRRTLARVLAQRGFAVSQAEDGAEALAFVAANDVDVVMLDLMMPGLSGLEVLAEVKRLRSDVECVMMTAYSRIEDAVASVRAGAYDFLTKPFASLDAVALTVGKAAERRRLIARARRLEQELERGVAGDGLEIIGQSPAMRAVFRLVDGVASSSSTILILGESGTGKELVARAIHRKSPRANKPFVAVNCSAIPENLIESELFGHVKGAFTSANASKAGLFELADKGTLFLDEVGDLSLAAQVKLLRALQEGEIKRVGSAETKNVDVRVVAATNVGLREQISAGKFREDLYYRLNVIALHLPPLRERREDVPLLAQHFLKKLSLQTGKKVDRIDHRAIVALAGYDWPGNVRQLENAVERAVVLALRDEITLDDLPAEIARGKDRPSATTRIDGGSGGPPSSGAPNGDRISSTALSPATSAEDPEGALQTALTAVAHALAEMGYAEAKRHLVREFDRAYATAMLQRSGGNVSEAARLAGLDRSNFRRVLRKHG
jgi:two-component system response regulator HydG